MKPYYKIPKAEENISNGTAIIRIISTTIINVLFMSFAFVLGAASSWQNAGEGTYLVGLICFAPIVISLIFAVVQYRRGKMHMAIRGVKWVIPSIFLFALGIAIVGEAVRATAHSLGIQPPCAFRWPPCDK